MRPACPIEVLRNPRQGGGAHAKQGSGAHGGTEAKYVTKSRILVQVLFPVALNKANFELGLEQVLLTTRSQAHKKLTVPPLGPSSSMLASRYRGHERWAIDTHAGVHASLSSWLYLGRLCT